MSMMTTQTENTPAVTENSASPEKTLDGDIRDLESKAAAEEAETTRATRATNALLIITGVVALFTALAGLWGTRASGRLRATENLLNSLRMTKVRADAEEEAKRVEIGAQEREAQIKADAEVKIAEAHAVGKQADEKAGTANERAAAIEKQNLELRGGVAGLEKEAAEARAEQQRIQTELARQQERAANAELALLDIQERFQPRHLTPAQEEQFVAIVKEGAKGRVRITYAPNVPESAYFAVQIFNLLVFRAGWADVEFPEPDRSLYPLVGVQMNMTNINVENRPPHAATLEKAFLSVGMGLGASPNGKLPEGLIILNMALKPGKY